MVIDTADSKKPDASGAQASDPPIPEEELAEEAADQMPAIREKVMAEDVATQAPLVA